MRLLVSGAGVIGRSMIGHPQYGILKVPHDRAPIAAISATGIPWACDNECFQSLDRAAYLAMIRAAAGSPTLLWVSAPDVVADAAATRTRFDRWAPALHYFGLPIAYVAQDGQESIPVPWDRIRCLFIGGSTQWKLSADAEALIHEAHDRGKWVHVGRVNTLKRMRWFSSLPVDSIDGSGFSKWPHRIPWMVRHLNAVQHRLPGA